ncbi:LacI family transcriptional regulator [Paractinoplanes abujensis]|uniref:DNA-binding LacI/PurR family transcriptional regulator n=1 Tax=Paractinoplanes abujensis TaxID=882441 RepID=A0A7W7CMX2_9ACTN|nr:substrate-binding domain-containing protein [Actinoplanes abujensis]MBB4691500.1 DNA-binding LacI/PurR family transcriptional regulator [Actinoplanes abujensis]GID17084.1 LacI family transcriptional regulator [Actinoplanes abujensis]
MQTRPAPPSSRGRDHRSPVVGVVAQNTTLYGPASMVQAIGDASLDADLPVTIGHVSGDDAAGASRRLVRRLTGQGVAGLIVIAPVDAAADMLQAVPAGLPVVTVDGPPGCPAPDVSVDQHAGGVLATRHLLANGHRTVWHVAGPEQWHGSRAREAGWRAALAEAGVSAPPTVRADWSAASGYRCGRLLAENPACTAVFAANDDIALGVMRAMTERGRRIPEDVSVVGFDDVPEAGYTFPGLTTVRQEFADVGREALRLLLDQLGSGRHTTESVRLKPVLMPRGTVTSRTTAPRDRH